MKNIGRLYTRPDEYDNVDAVIFRLNKYSGHSLKPDTVYEVIQMEDGILMIQEIGKTAMKRKASNNGKNHWTKNIGTIMNSNDPRHILTEDEYEQYLQSEKI